MRVSAAKCWKTRVIGLRRVRSFETRDKRLGLIDIEYRLLFVGHVPCMYILGP